MATHSNILAWSIPWTEEPGGLIVHGVAKIQTRLSDYSRTYIHLAQEGKMGWISYWFQNCC